jgi:hypothetical protein
MATWTIQINAQTGVSVSASGTHATTLGEAQPGDFDGATINSVTVSSPPTTSVNVSDNDTLGVHFIIETSAGTDIYGTAGGADSATMCFAAESTTGSTIADGSSTSPAPTTAVAADWDNVYWEVTYSQVQMADATREISWTQFNVVVDYTASAGATKDPGISTDGNFTGQVPLVQLGISVPAGSLAFGEDAPTAEEDHVVFPGISTDGVLAGVIPTRAAGLLFRTHAPTVDVSAGGNVSKDPGISTDGTLTGLQPTVEEDHIVFPTIGSLSGTGLQPTISEDHVVFPGISTDGNFTGLQPALSESHVIFPPLNAATFSGQTPLVQLEISVPIGGLTAAGLAPTAEEDHVVYPSIGAASLNGQIPVLSEDHVVYPGISADGALAGLVPFVQLDINHAPEPGLGGATFGGLQPTVSEDHVVFPGISTDGTLTGQSVTTDLGIVVATSTDGTFTGLQPTVEEDHIVYPGISADGTLAGSAPFALQGADVTKDPGAGAITATGLFPAWYETIPGQLSALIIAGYAPVVSDDPKALPGRGLAVTTGYEPNARLSTTALDPLVGTITASGSAPTRPAGLLFRGHVPTLSGLSQTIPVNAGSLSTAGAIATFNWGILGQIGTATFSGSQPTVTATQTISVDVSTDGVFAGQQPSFNWGILGQVGSATFDGKIPAVDVTTNITRDPGAGSLTISPGSQPTLSENHVATPPASSLVTAGQVPVLAEDHQLDPAAASLVTSGSSPLLNITLAPAADTLSLAGAIPVLAYTLAPAAANLSLTGQVPGVSQDYTVEPSIGSITATGTAPLLAQTLFPAAGTLSFSGQISTLSEGIQLQPGAGALVAAGQQPSFDRDWTIEVTVGGVSTAGTVATLSITGTTWTPIASAGATWSDVGSAGATIWTDVPGAAGSWEDN